MRLGLALGAGFQSALNTFGTVNDLADKMDERDADKRVRDAVQNAPREGAEITAPDGTTRRVTARDRSDAIASAMESGGRTRDVVAAQTYRASGLQMDRSQMEVSRLRTQDNLLQAARLARQGNFEGATRLAISAYNDGIPDGGQVNSFRMENGLPVLVTTAGERRFSNPEQAVSFVEGLLDLTTPETYQAMVRRRFDAEQNDANRAVTREGQRLQAGVGMAGVAATREGIAAADRRHSEELALRRSQQSTQSGLIEQQTREIRQRVSQREDSVSGLDEFERRLRENPLDPELPRLATRLYTRDPEGFRGVVQRELPDGTRERVPVNTLGMLLDNTRERFGVAVGTITSQLGNTPAARDVEAARASFDRMWGEGSFNRQFGDRYSGAPSAPAAPASRSSRQNQGLPVGRAPAPAADPFTGRPSAPQVPYDAYRPPAPAPTGGGSHPAPGLPQRQPQQPPPGASRSAIDEWLRANPPPQVR